jgi:hypothetical protein
MHHVIRSINGLCLRFAIADSLIGYPVENLDFSASVRRFRS